MPLVGSSMAINSKVKGQTGVVHALTMKGDSMTQSSDQTSGYRDMERYLVNSLARTRWARTRWVHLHTYGFWNPAFSEGLDATTTHHSGIGQKECQQAAVDLLIALKISHCVGVYPSK